MILFFRFTQQVEHFTNLGFFFFCSFTVLIVFSTGRMYRTFTTTKTLCGYHKDHKEIDGSHVIVFKCAQIRYPSGYKWVLIHRNAQIIYIISVININTGLSTLKLE